MQNKEKSAVLQRDNTEFLKKISNKKKVACYGDFVKSPHPLIYIYLKNDVEYCPYCNHKFVK